MKRLLLGSVILLIFSCSILIFQLSCKKDVIAQTTGNNVNKILFFKRPLGNYDLQFEHWIANYDGSNATQIFLNLPGWRINDVQLSADGTKLFFTGTDSTTLLTTQASEIFSSNVDGSNIQQITHDNVAGKSTLIWNVQ
jgi:hypothetical protein